MKKRIYMSPDVEAIKLAAQERILAGSETDTEGNLNPLDGVIGDFDWTLL